MAKIAITWTRAVGVVGVTLSVFLAIWWGKAARSTVTSNLPMLTRLDPIEVREF